MALKHGDAVVPKDDPMRVIYVWVDNKDGTYICKRPGKEEYKTYKEDDLIKQDTNPMRVIF